MRVLVKIKLKCQVEDSLSRESSTNSVDSVKSLSPTSKLKKEFKTNYDTQTRIDKEFKAYEICKDAKKEEKILSWWKRNQQSFPLLAKFARKYLVIPAISTKSETVFSTGGNVVTPKRGRLDPDMVEQLVVCHENVHLLKDFDK